MNFPLLHTFSNRIKSIFNGQQWNIRYLENVLWSFSEKVVKFLVELFVGFYLARFLGVSDFGVLNYALSFSILFQGISSLGLSEILTREFVNYRDQVDKMLSTALSLRLIAALVFVVIINVLSWNESPVVRYTIFAVSLSLLFRSFEVIIYFFQSIVKSELTSKIQLVTTFVVAAIKIYLITINASLPAFAWAYSIEWLLIAMGLTVALVKNMSLSFHISRIWAKKLVKDAWPLMAASVAINLYMRIDQVMIRKLIGDIANGYYSAALRLTEIWYVVPMVIGSVLFPAILNAKNKNPELYQTRVLVFNAFLFWTSFLLALIISPFSEFIIVALYDDSFLPAAEILSIQIWSGIFSFLGVAGTYWLLAENLQYFSLVRTLIGLGVSLLLNFLLIPVIGAKGAAISALVTQMFAATISLFILKKTRVLAYIQMKSIVYPFIWFKKYLIRKSENRIQ